MFESSKFQAPAPHLFNPLADLMNSGADGVLNSKTKDLGSYFAKVIEYLPETMEARVLLQSQYGSATDKEAIKVKIGVKRQGEVPGTGEAFQLTPGQLVMVQFQGGATTGLYNQGVITGTVYTHNDQRAPVSPMRARKDGKGYLYVSHDEDGVLSTAVYELNGNKYTVLKGDNITQTIGGAEYVVTGGPSTLRVEEIMRKTGKNLKSASDNL